MIAFNDIEHLKDEWINGRFDYSEDIVISDIPYHFRSSSIDEFSDIVRGKKAYVVYQTSLKYKEGAVKKGMHQWILLIWAMDDKSILRPYDIRVTSPSRAASSKVTEAEQERIGDVVILKIDLPSGTAAIKGKIDTGAEVSSLHAKTIKIVGGMVKFTSPELSQHEISVPLVNQQAVKTVDGGINYRPVIELNIEINGKRVNKALFNLTDREQMEHPCLIGQNVLEKTKFLIDPNLNTSPKSPIVDSIEFDFDAFVNEQI